MLDHLLELYGTNAAAVTQARYMADSNYLIDFGFAAEVAGEAGAFYSLCLDVSGKPLFARVFGEIHEVILDAHGIIDTLVLKSPGNEYALAKAKYAQQTLALAAALAESSGSGPSRRVTRSTTWTNVTPTDNISNGLTTVHLEGPVHVLDAASLGVLSDNLADVGLVDAVPVSVPPSVLLERGANVDVLHAHIPHLQFSSHKSAYCLQHNSVQVADADFSPSGTHCFFNGFNTDRVAMTARTSVDLEEILDSEDEMEMSNAARRPGPWQLAYKALLDTCGDLCDELKALKQRAHDKESASQKHSALLQIKYNRARKQLEMTKRELAPLSARVNGLVLSHNTLQKVASVLDSEAACSICFESAQFPDMLTECGHSFCQKCLVDWFTRCQSKDVDYGCPKCSALVDSFPVENRMLASVVEMLIESGLLDPNDNCTSRAVSPYSCFFWNGAEGNDE
ncbi:hypothetical protein C8R46DRAFT_1030673 [Mycena filopes]|nr:hypothetical protein C8R46DRAFT_1030673 [Mycena filopes]